MFRFALIAFVASVSADVIVNGPCPAVKRVDNFDFNAYAKGIWYEIGRYPNLAESKGECGSAEYKLIEDNLAKVTNYHVANKQLRSIDGLHRLAPDAGNTGKITVSLPYGANGTYTNHVLNILAIDYNSYAVGYYCKYDEAKRSRHDFAWILSRCKSLSTNSRAGVEKAIKESNILNIDNFIWPSFCDEDCRAYS